ncbi:acyl-CoA synthetase [Amylibacter kogurei]|uniref:Acyl-CoA synthetase n=1 Tax=Paramylibacter kogurei TaxID=1889778 RepID=A0A2G5K378_9RHOB|nr:acetate--CoA ligase family protein [Amylibacter kogurei]PIB23998.1 acyl-CoA synthetase [Amylibacter kogurei]
MKRNLDRLFRAKTIAVIGGGTWCDNIIQQAFKIGFDGAIYPIHPTKEKIQGVKCFATINALPTPPDACFIGVNRHATIDIVSQLRKIGAGGAICFASGFSEAIAEDKASADLQSALLTAAGDMPIIGPNCYGFINYLDRIALWPDQHGGQPVDSGVAIITQSSNIAINLTMQQRGLPIAYVVTAGNQAQISLSAIGEHLLSDPRVTALGLHIEGIADLSEFQQLAANARERGKTIVALKVGKSERAQSATLSHTASLAGSEASARALFTRLGIAQVESLPQMLEALKILHCVGPLASNAIASMSCSGGEASLIADCALGYDVHFPPLSETQKTNLSIALGPMVALSNPLDYHTYIWGHATKMTATFRAMLEPHIALGILVLDFPRGDICDQSAWTDVIQCVIDARDQSGVPMAILATLPENMPEDLANALMRANIIPLLGLDDALAAIAAVSKIAKLDIHDQPVLTAKLPTNARPLTEESSKQRLYEFGISVPKSTSSTNIETLGAIARNIGFPVALKGQGIAHKTEMGAVVLNLSDGETIETAAKSMPCDDFLIEEMIADGVAELLIGVTLDPAHGYCMTIAAGGVLSELLTDSVSITLPTCSNEIIAGISSLKINKILSGYRGKPAANQQAIVDAALSLQNYVIANAGRVTEVEINPLICTPTRAIAADALIILGDKDD